VYYTKMGNKAGACEGLSEQAIQIKSRYGMKMRPGVDRKIFTLSKSAVLMSSYSDTKRYTVGRRFQSRPINGHIPVWPLTRRAMIDGHGMPTEPTGIRTND
jgi:hypothetical protein